MPTKLCKWGNSLGVRLPQYIAERAGLTAGDFLYISLRDNGEIVIKPVKAKDIPPQLVSTDADQQLRSIEPPMVW